MNALSHESNQENGDLNALLAQTLLFEQNISKEMQTQLISALFVENVCAWFPD